MIREIRALQRVGKIWTFLYQESTNHISRESCDLVTAAKLTSMDILVHLPDHGVVVCRPCGAAIAPHNLQAHLAAIANGFLD